ncbi:MoaD/ThiS family protein [Dyadobacter subterraneus]|uniref:Molybdopterin synthase sulfur carrier subunit n=1 Tax=Dyadobacter subterraneus TaxID=2773304 RepID=A0ABR9WLD8_9BACT|nr:MoaD/ThiS family protein [Dyadobacter subterraneus]MBE9464989.1 MoaD/ThiS family protein [Dyadobacter subterraneus]
MSINILYFGMLAEISGQAKESFPGKENMTVKDLKEQLFEKYPQLREKKFKVAINQKIGDDGMIIPSSAEIALLPPFAGG